MTDANEDYQTIPDWCNPRSLSDKSTYIKKLELHKQIVESIRRQYDQNFPNTNKPIEYQLPTVEDDEGFYESVMSELRSLGWNVQLVRTTIPAKISCCWCCAAVMYPERTDAKLVVTPNRK